MIRAMTPNLYKSSPVGSFSERFVCVTKKISRSLSLIHIFFHRVGPLGKPLGAADISPVHARLEKVQLNIHLPAFVAAILPNAVNVFHIVYICFVGKNILVLI